MSDPPQAPTITGLLAASDVAPGTVLADRFRVEAMLGIGGMGVVYRATDLDLGVQVAVKLLRPEQASRPEAFERFRQELLLARQVSSPRVVRIHDIARHGERWLISMDLVEGEPLDRMLDRRGPLPVEEALAIVRQLAEGLEAAHARGVIHRDLKPSNVLVSPGGDVYISDFGVARSLRSSGHTQAGTILGTPDYLSPEQARGDTLDGRSDLYALGLVLYELLTGRQPFGGGTPTESLSQRLVGTPPDIGGRRSDLPRWVARLVHRLLQPRPAQRLPDTRAVIRAIDHKHVPLDLRPGRRAGWALAALVLLALVAAIVLLRSGGSVGPPPAPDRLLVLADQAPGGMDEAWAGAVESLRLALANMSETPVVDGERTAQAVAQLGLAHVQERDVEAVAGMVPARRVLHLRLQDDAGRLALRGQLAGTRIEGPAAPTLHEASEGFAQAYAESMGTRPPGPWRVTPAAGALVDYGGGLLEWRSGRLTMAISRFEAAVAADAGHPGVWLALAETALGAGLYERADDALESGIAVAASGRMADEFSVPGALLGDDADAASERLASRLAAHPDDLDLRRQLARLAGETGNHARALELLAGLLERDPDDARAWYLSGKYLILSGDTRRAVDEHLVRALVLFKRSRNAFGEAEAVNALGIGYARLGQSAEAEEQYLRALALRRVLDDQRGTATTLRNLSDLAVIRGEHVQARAYLEEARDLYGRMGDRFGQSQMERETGLLSEEQGDYTAARDAFRMALRSRQRAGDIDGIGESLNDIGFANYQLGDYDSALVFWSQAAEAFEQAGNRVGQVRAQQNLGLLDIAQGRWEQAQARLEASLVEAESRQMAEEAAVSRRNLAELAILRGQTAAAARQLEHARRLFDERQDARGQADVVLLAARLALVTGDFDGVADLLEGFAGREAATSLEQRAIAGILQLALRQRLGREVPAALHEAALEAVQAAGLPVLELTVRALTGPDDPQLAEAVERLGNLPLTLQWRRLALTRALDARRTDAATTHGLALRRLLADHPGHAEAFEGHRQLHRLALLREDAAAADRALADALTARERLASGMAEAELEWFSQHPWSRALDEAGNGN